MRREPPALHAGRTRKPTQTPASSVAGSRARPSSCTIGKLAALTKVSADTLRYYEREKLLQPYAKSAGGYRLYDEEAEYRVRFIRHAQECSFTLAEIRVLLTLRSRNSACCDDVKRVAIERKLQLETRIGKMKSMSATLDRLIGACVREQLPVDACPILLGLDQMGAHK